MLLASALTVLTAIRALMAARGYQAYIVPYGGQHFSETLAGCEQRIAGISNFTGNSAFAIITPTDALLWTNGKQFLHAESQLDLNHWTLINKDMPGVKTELEWLKANLQKGNKVGVDGVLFPKVTFEKMGVDLFTAGILLEDDLEPNLIDRIAVDLFALPDCPAEPIKSLAGERSVADKLAQVRQKMGTEKVDLLLLSELDEIAWLFNLRGNDLPHVFYAYATIRRDRATLLVQDVTFPYDVEQQLDRINVTVLEGGYAHAGVLFKDEVEEDHILSVWVSTYVNYRMASVVPTKGIDAQRLVVKQTPVSYLKTMYSGSPTSAVFSTFTILSTVVAQQLLSKFFM